MSAATVLAAIENRPVQWSVPELMAATGVKPSYLSNILGDLHLDGLVELTHRGHTPYFSRRSLRHWLIRCHWRPEAFLLTQHIGIA